MTPEERLSVAIAALVRIAEHESRADRRARGMVDASLQRTARVALAEIGGRANA